MAGKSTHEPSLNHTLPDLFSTHCEWGFQLVSACGMTWLMASPAPDPASFTSVRRWLPLGIIAGLMIVAYAFGLEEHLNLQDIAANREDLRRFIANNWALALLIYVTVYVAAVALSIPAAGLLTVIGGLLFGWLAGAIATVFAATAGATIIFLAARTFLEKVLARKSGPLMTRIREGFARDAFNYLLFIRFVPLFPFWLVNIAAALAHLRLKTFVSATFLGIIPVTTVFSFAGASLDSVIEAQRIAYEACLAQNGPAACSFDLSASNVITPRILVAFGALGAVALMPVIVRKLMAKP